MSVIDNRDLNTTGIMDSFPRRVFIPKEKNGSFDNRGGGGGYLGWVWACGVQRAGGSIYFKLDEARMSMTYR